MSDTPEKDAVIAELAKLAQRLERERDEASSELVAVLKRRRWKEDLKIAFVLVFICMVAALCISTARHEVLKKEAVQRGYAEFVSNADGVLVWKWKEEAN